MSELPKVPTSGRRAAPSGNADSALKALNQAVLGDKNVSQKIKNLMRKAMVALKGQVYQERNVTGQKYPLRNKLPNIAKGKSKVTSSHNIAKPPFGRDYRVRMQCQ
jgi:hypothetical protein